MKLAVLMLIALIIPATLGGQQINGAEKLGQETPVQSSPDDPSKPRPTLGAHHLPATTSPDGCWTVTPLYHNGRFVSYEWTEVEHPAPPKPPEPPAPPKPPPAPVPPVVPTPQCEVVYYIEPTPYAPVSGPTWQYGHTVRGGCGLLRRIFGRYR